MTLEELKNKLKKSIDDCNTEKQLVTQIMLIGVSLFAVAQIIGLDNITYDNLTKINDGKNDNIKNK
jgi:hypothetical protein